MGCLGAGFTNSSPSILRIVARLLASFQRGVPRTAVTPKVAAAAARSVSKPTRETATCGCEHASAAAALCEIQTRGPAHQKRRRNTSPDSDCVIHDCDLMTSDLIVRVLWSDALRRFGLPLNSPYTDVSASTRPPQRRIHSRAPPPSVTRASCRCRETAVARSPSRTDSTSPFPCCTQRLYQNETLLHRCSESALRHMASDDEPTKLKSVAHEKSCRSKFAFVALHIVR
jgi:hypothetical protein